VARLPNNSNSTEDQVPESQMNGLPYSRDLNRILTILDLDGLIRIEEDRATVEDGWFRSFREQASVDDGRTTTLDLLPGN